MVEVSIGGGVMSFGMRLRGRKSGVSSKGEVDSERVNGV